MQASQQENPLSGFQSKKKHEQQQLEKINFA